MTYRSALIALSLVVSGLASAGCDGGTDDTDGGEVEDASSRADAGRDAHVPRVDAGPPTDAGTSGDDAGTSDASPSDAGPPDAGAPEPCESPGTAETVACGSCGTVDRFCTSSRVWAYGACEDEGECAPGSLDSEACGFCGTQSRRCTIACAWEDVGDCEDAGECTPGDTETSGEGCDDGEVRDLTCSAACVFEPTSACAAEPCAPRGAIEDVLCGMCGTQERFCTNEDTWRYEDCTDEGVCVAGTTGTVPCGMCGTRPALCNASCDWVPVSSGACTGEGVCAPGERERTTDGCSGGETRLVECGASCGFTIEIEPCAASVPVDVLFLPDATASNFSQFRAQVSTFRTRCLDPLLAIDDVHVGLAYYGDHGVSSETFIGAVELDTGTAAAIAADITGQSDLGGADDSTMEALHILTGATPQAGATPFVCSSGRVAGGCWRPSAQRVIVMHTDEFAKGGPDPAGAGLLSPWPTGPDWTDVRPRLLADDTLLLVMLDDDYDTSSNGQYREMVTDLGQSSTTDVYVENFFDVDGVGLLCDDLVARVQALAGL